MRIATWNVERLKHKAELDKIYAEIETVKADILVLTETDTRISPPYRYCYSTPLLAEEQPDFYAETENRVSIYSDYPCIRAYETYDKRTAVCVELDTDYGSLVVYGTIMGIFGNREKSFKADLIKQMADIRRLTADGKSICVIGDYNLTFCDNYYYTKFGRDTVEDTFRECGIGILTRDREQCIDHIAISNSFMEDRNENVAGHLGARHRCENVKLRNISLTVTGTNVGKNCVITRFLCLKRRVLLSKAPKGSTYSLRLRR